MKCKSCGAEIISISLPGNKTITCGADAVTYWLPKKDPIVELYTPNGEKLYGSLVGELKDAIGIGYVPHTCFFALETVCSYDGFTISKNGDKYYAKDEDGTREVTLVKSLAPCEYEDLSIEEILALCGDYDFSGELDDCSAYCFWKEID